MTASHFIEPADRSRTVRVVAFVEAAIVTVTPLACTGSLGRAAGWAAADPAELAVPALLLLASFVALARLSWSYAHSLVQVAFCAMYLGLAWPVAYLVAVLLRASGTP